MRLNPTTPANENSAGARRGQKVLSTHAPAKAVAVCPLGKDQLPGFFPTTNARTTSMNGRLRRKTDLVGNSTIAVAMPIVGSATASAGPASRTPATRAAGSPADQ